MRGVEKGREGKEGRTGGWKGVERVRPFIWGEDNRRKVRGAGGGRDGAWG